MSSLEELLQDTLKDFEDDSYITKDSSTPQPPGENPKAAPSNVAVPKGLAFDPLKKKKFSKDGKQSARADPSMPANVQQLYDDLTRLINDTPIGEAARPFGNARASAFEVAAGVDASVQGQDELQFTSQALRDLANQTKKTVEEQKSSSKGPTLPARPAKPLEESAPSGHLTDILGSITQPGAPAMNMLVDTIMQNLLSKDVLYGPLKEIATKYPPWLEANQGKFPEEQWKRYTDQYESIQKVCAQYENNPGDFATLVTLIQEMQTYGDPPKEIVSEMTGDLEPDLAGILNLDPSLEPFPDQALPGNPEAMHPELEDFAKTLDRCHQQ